MSRQRRPYTPLTILRLAELALAAAHGVEDAEDFRGRPAVLHQHRHDFKRHQVAFQSALQVLYLRLGHLGGLRGQPAAKLPLAVHDPQG